MLHPIVFHGGISLLCWVLVQERVRKQSTTCVALRVLRSVREGQYGVERLLNHRLKKGCKNNLEFLVRWEGYGPESDSWEPRVNIEGSLIQEYSTG